MHKPCANCGKDIVNNGNELCDKCTDDVYLQMVLDEQRKEDEMDRIRNEGEGGPILD